MARGTSFLRVFLCALALGWALTGGARASGYGLREATSASAFGNAFAGATSSAEDISFMHFNPASLTRHTGTQVVIGGTAILPEARFQGGSASNFLGTPIPGSQSDKDAAPDAVAPLFYGMWETSPDTRVGLGITVPWGLTTDHPSDWIGRYHAIETRFVAVNVNPAAAYRINRRLSIGAGLQIQYGDGTLSNAVDFGTLAFGVPSLDDDGRAEIKADGWGFGFNFGVLYEPVDGTRIGLGYRSSISHTLKGDTEFSGALAPAFDPLFTDTVGRAKLTTPEILSFGVTHEINSRWTVMAEIAWTNWSRFQELRIRFDNPAQPDDVTLAQWDDAMFYSLGATYRASDNWRIRGGLAFDESPVPDSTRNPRIPDEDRLWVALGASYRGFKGVTIDVSFVHFFIDDADIDLSAAQTGNTFRGNLSGSFELTANLFAVQAVIPF